MPFCRGDCTKPTDQSATVQPILYPNAKKDGAGSAHFLAPGTGHLINAHLNARKAWEHQLGFLKGNGFWYGCVCNCGVITEEDKIEIEMRVSEVMLMFAKKVTRSKKQK